MSHTEITLAPHTKTGILILGLSHPRELFAGSLLVDSKDSVEALVLSNHSAKNTWER